MVFLVAGTYPLTASPVVFFCLFLPFFISCQLLFQVAGNGSKGLWRGQQWSFALFPTWIAATCSGAAAVFLGKHLAFSVTAKSKQATGRGFQHVRLQVVAMALLVVSSLIGIARVSSGGSAALSHPHHVGLGCLGPGAFERGDRCREVPGGRGDHLVEPMPTPKELASVLGATTKPTP